MSQFFRVILVLLIFQFRPAFTDSAVAVSDKNSEPAAASVRVDQFSQQMPPAAQAAWDDYVFNTVATRTLQEGCEPLHVKPAAGIPYRGVVILLHGYTSCPKQYSQMAESLSGEGFHVLVPLLPGHGGAADNELDAQTFLPDAGNWQNYDAFARWLNTLAKGVTAGEVHIGGLCLGGTIAMRAMQLEPRLYKRAALFSPFLEVSTRLLGRLGRLLGRVNDILNVRGSFSMPVALEEEEICEGIERAKLGRAGYCRTRLGNLIAVARFGHFVKTNMKPLNVQLQTVIVENDPVAHPIVTLAAVESQTHAFGRFTAACVLREDASHSFFSPTDLPMPKLWLGDFHAALNEFLVKGKPFILAKPSMYAWPRSGAAVSSCALWP